MVEYIKKYIIYYITLGNNSSKSSIFLPENKKKKSVRNYISM